MIGLSPCGRDVWRTAVRLTVINSSYNTREHLSDCLESISRNPTSVPYEIVVVDDASTD
jgi:glycosyltransferase involved in cell wall biosynthesis